VKSIRAKPVKSSIYGSIGVFLYASCKNDPDEIHFLDQLKKSQQLVSQVPLNNQNPTIVQYLKKLEQCRNNETLRITSFGFFSLLWIDDFASSQSTYDSKCEYLQPQLRTFHERVVDVGFWNNWWGLQNKMKDYDVNF
jgi:Translocase of the Inner Mitochondrial membrane 29